MTAVPTPLSAQPAAAGDPPWNRLGEPALGAASTPLVSAILAFLSLGLLPAVLWPVRWGKMLERERPFYRELATWWRRRVSPADGARLDSVLSTLRPRPLWILLPWLATGFVAATLGYGAYLDGPQHLWASTFGFHQNASAWAWPPADSFWGRLHASWLWGLGIAYACQWHAVRSHARAVSRLVGWTNAVARENNYRTIRNDPARSGLGPLWVGVGVTLAFLHYWWAIPMVLAGASQRRYAETATPRLQRELSNQAGDAIGSGRHVESIRFCPDRTCGTRLPAVARFCSRCGAAVALGTGERAEA